MSVDVKKESRGNVLSEEEKEELLKRMPKRLSYILRYGAVKEGLQVNENGYVKLLDLPKVNLLSNYTPEEILQEVKTSMSYRNTHRYEWREKDGAMFVRAAYLRNFEKSPYHKGTKVNTLVESCLLQVMNNLKDYDLEDFPDEEMIRLMIRRLKRKKKLTSSALQTLLVPTITRLDLEDVYLTNKILRTLYTNCPHLTAVSFKDCGYIITDSVLANLTKNLPHLQRLNLCGCDHLTPNCLAILSKRLTDLRFVNIAHGPTLTVSAVQTFLTAATRLEFLDVYNLNTDPQEYKTLTALALDRGIQLSIRTPKSLTLETSMEDLDINKCDDKADADTFHNEGVNGGSDDDDGGDDSDWFEDEDDEYDDKSDELVLGVGLRLF